MPAQKSHLQRQWPQVPLWEEWPVWVGVTHAEPQKGCKPQPWLLTWLSVALSIPRLHQSSLDRSQEGDTKKCADLTEVDGNMRWSWKIQYMLKTIPVKGIAVKPPRILSLSLLLLSKAVLEVLLLVFMRCDQKYGAGCCWERGEEPEAVSAVCLRCDKF